MAIAEASAGPPEAEEFEPEVPEPNGELPEPKGKDPDPNGELPEPEGRLVDGGEVCDELDLHATLPTPKPAAMAITTISATTVAVHERRVLAEAVASPCWGTGPTQ